MLPSWDLLITALFATIIAFTFIVGKDTTQKIIIATYIGILATDGFAYFLYRMFLAPAPQVGIVNVSATATTLVTIKLILFVVSVVLLTARGSFTAVFPGGTSGVLGVVVQAGLGFLLGALVTSTLLVFLAGSCFLPGVTCSASNVVDYITTGSQLARHLLTYAYVWFMLPALALVLASAFGGGND